MNVLSVSRGKPCPSVTVPLQRNGTTTIFKEVPADVCENCGEYYLSEEITVRSSNGQSVPCKVAQR